MHGKMTFYNDIYAFYPQQRTPFICDVDLLTVILVFLVFAAAFLLILPGIRGKLRFLWMSRIILNLFIGAVIVAVQFSGDWATANVRTSTTYKSFSRALINAEVGLHVGLSGINITLKGNPVEQLNETINYNEIFWWTGNFQDDYTMALERGLPTPILYIAEKFSDSSPCGLKFQYRVTGSYASATLWAAFCCWLIANILFSVPVILYAGCMMLAAATLIFFSLASFSTIQNIGPCNFTVGTRSFQTNFGASFWLLLATGLLCSAIGSVVVLLDLLIPEKMRETFSVCVDDDNDRVTSLGEGYLNSKFLEGITTLSPEGLTFTTVRMEQACIKDYVTT